MIALVEQLYEAVIECVSYSDTKFIGDYQLYCPYITVYPHTWIHNELAMFCLVTNDPTLKHVVLGDRFKTINGPNNDGEEFDRFGDHEDHNAIHEGLLTILQAINSNTQIDCLSFCATSDYSAIWREDPSRDALINVVQEKKLIEWMSFLTTHPDLTHLGDLVQHFPQVKAVRLSYKHHSEGGGIISRSLLK
jgi:hypothetical protein